MQNQTSIYLDNAATTPLHAVARAAMEPYWSEVFGNPSSPYAVARAARMALDEARTAVARLIGAHADEIVWTSGGTESDNWALLGVALANWEEKGHFIVSAIEHDAVREPCDLLRAWGFEVEMARSNGQGMVEAGEIASLLRPDTRLVSVMSANNETGVLQPVGEVGRLCRANETLFHVDATQSAGKVPLDVDFVDAANPDIPPAGADLMTLSAHKIGGPKGCGALYVRRGTPMRALQRGGAQERGRRSGTENVPAIAGFGAMATWARANLVANEEHLRALRTQLEAGLVGLGTVRILGIEALRAPHIASFILDGVRAESLALKLDLHGIAIGTGSACASGALEPSHVLAAMGYSALEAKSALRVSFGVQNTAEEVEQLLTILGQR